jgi:hypothetical protein
LDPTFVVRGSTAFGNARNIPSFVLARSTPSARVTRNMPGRLILNMLCRALELQAR